MKNFILVVLFLPSLTFATHLRCGHISVKKTSSLTVQVSISVYTYTGSPVKFGSGTLDFGDGTTHTTPTVENTFIYPGTGFVSYSIEHVYSKAGWYQISYTERNLISGIMNVSNSVNAAFYLETGFELNENVDYASPEFLAPPILRQPSGALYSFSSAAIDENNYKLAYALASPLFPLQGGYEMPSSISVNYFNGTVQWDGKFGDFPSIGVYLFGVRVAQFDETGKLKGFVLRTLEVTVEDANGSIGIGSTVSDFNSKVFVDVGKNKTVKVQVQDTSDSVNWILLADKAVEKNLNWSKYDSTAGNNKVKIGLLKISSTTDVVRDNPYSIVLRAVSNAGFSTTYRDVPLLFFTKDISLPIYNKDNPAPTIITSVGYDGSELSVFPNPFQNKIQIQGLPQGTVIEVRNALGQLMTQATIQLDNDVDLSALPAGIYFILLPGQQTTKRVKICKM
jgi:hypothetical protein